jgi:hypothetical protein
VVESTSAAAREAGNRELMIDMKKSSSGTRATGENIALKQ